MGSVGKRSTSLFFDSSTKFLSCGCLFLNLSERLHLHQVFTVWTFYSVTWIITVPSSHKNKAVQLCLVFWLEYFKHHETPHLQSFRGVLLWNVIQQKRIFTLNMNYSQQSSFTRWVFQVLKFTQDNILGRLLSFCLSKASLSYGPH
jgi:hypothetical protein